MNGWRIAQTVLRTELRQLARDRRALFAAVILPALLYPVLFRAGDTLERISEDTMAAREVNLALDLSGLSEVLADRARDRLAQEGPIQLLDVDASELLAIQRDMERDEESRKLAVRSHVREQWQDGSHLTIVTAPSASATGRAEVHFFYDIKDDISREARERARKVFRELREEERRARREQLLGGDPVPGLDFTLVDVASAEQQSGASLGRWLPLLAVLLLISGGAYAALAVFSGERESGTLETLLVQPVPAVAVSWGKFGAVFAAGLLTLLVNMGSILTCTHFGLGGLPGVEGGIQAGQLLSGFVYLPGVVLMCALLCWICGRARTFREGQQWILPVTLIAAAPTSVALQPGLEHSAMLAMIPFTGPALSLRDALRGELTWLPTLIMVISHACWSWLALTRVAHILDAERVFRTPDTESESAARRLHGRRALRWGFVGVLAIYLVGSRLQAWDADKGFLISLWGLLPLLTLGWLRKEPRPWLRTLGFFIPRPAHLAGAVLCVPALVLLMVQFIGLQEQLLPIPESMTQAEGLEAMFASKGTWLLLFFYALTPGVCEELFFRGALLAGMRRDMSTPMILFWQAILFGAAHASIYRILPTAIIGALLAALTLRTKSIWPAILLHAVYDGALVLHATERMPWIEASWAPWLLLLAIPGLWMLRGKYRD